MFWEVFGRFDHDNFIQLSIFLAIIFKLIMLTSYCAYFYEIQKNDPLKKLLSDKMAILGNIGVTNKKF